MAEMAAGNLERAVAHDRRALEEYQRVGNRGGVATAHANLSEKLDMLGQYEEAWGLSEGALAMARELGNAFTTADVLATRASISLHRGDNITAVAEAEAAAELFASIQVVDRAAAAQDLAAAARSLVLAAG
jgi:tetratricopeptide (TPR) repeat protein